jgi:hypothetical protein
MKRKILISLTSLFVIGLFIGLIIPTLNAKTHDMDERRVNFLEYRNAMRGEMLNHGNYACCLETPCTYCIEKTPGHGEGATCTCLDDVMNGRHPCGECIGEIMEGYGNKFLAKYFASAIAEEVGEEHLETMKLIMADKYSISVEEQF